MFDAVLHIRFRRLGPPGKRIATRSEEGDRIDQFDWLTGPVSVVRSPEKMGSPNQGPPELFVPFFLEEHSTKDNYLVVIATVLGGLQKHIGGLDLAQRLQFAGNIDVGIHAKGFRL